MKFQVKKITQRLTKPGTPHITDGVRQALRITGPHMLKIDIERHTHKIYKRLWKWVIPYIGVIDSYYLPLERMNRTVFLAFGYSFTFDTRAKQRTNINAIARKDYDFEPKEPWD